MTLSELRAVWRLQVEDVAQPYLWSDAEFAVWLNEAEQEACIRAWLLRDTSQTVATVVDQTDYALDAGVIDVASIKIGGEPFAGWDLYETTLILDAAPTAVETLSLTVFRLPSTTIANDTDSPEIAAKHHLRLLDWVRFRAYSKKDAETFDPNAAAQAEAQFERSFGRRHDANVQRKHRRKSARVVRSSF